MPKFTHEKYGWRQYGGHNRPPSATTKRNLLKNLILAAILLFLASSLGVLLLFAIFGQNLPNPNNLTQRAIKQSTKIYDRTGEHLLYEFFNNENRTLVKMAEKFCEKNSSINTDVDGIPLFAIQATIAAEDTAFCTHRGFSIKGLLRAVLFGGSRGGGSTLTQQLVKNAILTNERTYARKIKELILSVQLEQRYNKDEILQIYFNEIPYGSTYYGIQAAATNFFGKQVKDISIAEAAALAALPQATTRYINNPDLLAARRNWILERMKEFSFITQDQYDLALKEKTPLQTKITKITAPHFVFYVKELLEQTYGKRMVEEGGLKVITTLDFDKQKMAEEAVVAGVEAKGAAFQFTNASLVAIDPKTGQIIAMVGSKDYFDSAIQGQVNVSLRPRQPGSSFKPIVYAKAFDLGYTPNTILWDVKTDFPTPVGLYSPNNYDLKERGPIRVRDALQGSLNIPAVQMLYLVGVDRALDFAETLGYSTFGKRSNFGLAVVLGGGEAKLLEHTAAYATFANDGVAQKPMAILKVEDHTGTILHEWQPRAGKEIVKPNVARMVSDVLSDNAARSYIFGPNNFLQLGARRAAAKTGTTNDYHDAWTIGYTPSLAVGVWVGNNNNAEMKRGADGSVVASPIWNQFMKNALEGQPSELFIQPEIPHTGKLVIDGIMSGTVATIDRASGKLATTSTPASYREERVYAEYHTILKYLDRNDPLGPVPVDPNQDPYFAAWETAILNWMERKQSETGIIIQQKKPPSEFDDLHIPVNTPFLSIVSVNIDENRVITISSIASAPRGLRNIRAFLDSSFVGDKVPGDFIIRSLVPNEITQGTHTLKVIACDDIDNCTEQTKEIYVPNDPLPNFLEIFDPKNTQTIEKTVSIFPVAVSLPNPTLFSSVILKAEKIDGEETTVGIITNPDSPILLFSWTLPEHGEWFLTAKALSKNRESDRQSSTVLVKVIPKPPSLENLNPFN